jgi:PST family polysaccharide transporter
MLSALKAASFATPVGRRIPATRILLKIPAQARSAFVGAFCVSDGEGQRAKPLAARIARGAGWIVAGRLAAGLLGFANMIVVARLLAPEDFGLVAMGLAAMQLLTNITDIGVGQAVIKFRDAGRAEYDTLFSFSAARGAVIALLLGAAAPFAAQFYDDPRVAYVFIGAGLYPLFTGFSNPKFFEFERALDYSKEFIAQFAGKLAAVIVSVGVAWATRSYWAIILGLAANGLAVLAFSYMLKPYRPSFTMAAWRRIVDFSGWLMGVGLMAALNNKLDSLILGRAANTSAAGHYFMGLQFAELPTREIAFPVSRAIYPGLSELQGEPDRMRLAFLAGVEALAAVAMPAAIGFALVAADFIPLLVGPGWEDAALVVAIITPVMGLQMPLLAVQYYAMAHGRTKLVFFRELIFFLVRTPLFIWGAVSHGVIGASLAVAGCGLFHVALNLMLYGRVSGEAAIAPLWRVRRTLAACAVMAALLALLHGPLTGVGPILRVALLVAAGGVIYPVAHWLLWRAEGAPDGVERTIERAIGPRLQKAVSSRRGQG